MGIKQGIFNIWSTPDRLGFDVSRELDTGLVRVSLHSHEGELTPFVFELDEWRDFLRAASADAAQFHYDRGPYRPAPEPKTVA